MSQFLDSFSEEIWNQTYKHHSDETIDDTFKRVAKYIASAEETEEKRLEWEQKFYEMLQDFKVSPGGRILANAGTEWDTTMINCFTKNRNIEDIDSIEGIYKVLLDQSLTLKSEGGWGCNFSFIRPRGSYIEGIGVESPGAVKFMEIFDKTSEVITSGSGKNSKNIKGKKKIRKGAQMAILDCFSKNTEILTEHGWVNIIDLIEALEEGKNIRVVGEDDNLYLAKNPVTHKKSQLYKLKLYNGDFIEVTGDHEVEVENQITGEVYLKPVKDIEIQNEYIATIEIQNEYIATIKIQNVLKKVFKKLKSITTDIIDSSYDFEVETKHRIIAKHVDCDTAFHTSNCHHKDIKEFITAKQNQGRLTKFNISVNCTNDFMNKVIGVDPDPNWDLIFPDTKHPAYKKEWNGDMQLWKSRGYPVIVHETVNALELWELIMKSTYNRAEPGVVFLEKANETHLWNYGGKDAKILETNPCQPDDATVITPSGIKKFKDIQIGDQIWSESGWTTIVNKQMTGIKPTFKYYTDAGFFYGTSTHRILENGIKIEVENASSMDILNGPVRNHKELNPLDIMDGLVLGDGSVHKASDNLVYLCIGNKDHDYFNSEISHLIKKKRDGLKKDMAYEIETTITHTELPLTFNRKIPERYMFGNSQKVCGFLRGLYTANGSICGKRVTLKSSSLEIIRDVQIMLSSIGIKSYYTTNEPKKVKFENGEYECKKSYDLNISSDRDKFLNQVGFIQIYKQQKLEEICKTKIQKSKSTYDITEIENMGEQRVYSITVDNKNHTYITGSVNVANCSEQVLPNAGSCNLASLNLTQFLNENREFDFEKFKKYVSYAVRFLDNVNSVTKLPLPVYEETVRNLRRIGLGVMGWGSLLYMMKIRFASDEAEELKEKIMKLMTDVSVNTSIDLAIEKGMFPKCNPVKHAEVEYLNIIEASEEVRDRIRTYGMRNSALHSCQPTGNSAIVANVVSGGIEPIFLPEYIRTVIVNSMPEELEGKCPKWYEGEWYETEIFKLSKEGDEDILIGYCDGVTYKIDRNRGLTKEVPCYDYGVRWLKERDEWDENADWAVSTVDLTVDEHVRDLAGWAKWMDSSISKTVNVAFDYPYEDFKNIYLDAFKSGYIKGITTYRAGTMTSVLSSSSNDVEDEEIILEDVKLPDSSPSVLKVIRDSRYKWYLTVCFFDKDHKRPFALFVKTNYREPSVQTEKATECLINLAKDKGVPTKYIEDLLLKSKYDNNPDKIARAISLNLRHGVLIKNIVSALDLVDEVIVGSFVYQIKKFLGGFVKDGTSVEGAVCGACGSSNLEFNEGCVKCRDCGSSKC